MLPIGFQGATILGNMNNKKNQVKKSPNPHTVFVFVNLGQIPESQKRDFSTIKPGVDLQQTH